MNKSKIILASTGGVIAVAVLAMAFFVWSSFAAKTAAIEGDDEGNDGLDTVVSAAQTLSRKPVFPSAASVRAIESNMTALAEWKDAAHKLIAAGDRVYEKTTTAAFKAFIVEDAKRLGSLPGAVNGALVKSDFAFGPFKGYIAEGKMPSDAQLAELQRRWDDVALITETLAAAGIAELVDVQYKAKEEPKEEVRDNKKGRRSAQRRPAAKAEPEVAPPAAYTYVFVFNTRPAAFVKALNALETGERFTVVEDFSFVRERDVIAEALGGDEKKEAASAGGRRGRRGRRAAVVEEEKKEDSPANNGIVTDPVLDAPFKVQMTVSVYDFRSLEEAKGEEVQK
jgi:hypothetical protein